MTEGIKIAIISAVGLVLAALVPLLFKRRAVKNPRQNIAVEEARPKSPQTTQNLTDLSHKQISDAIEATPPFHQQKFRESFAGKGISWRTQLSGISKYDGDEMTVYGTISGSHTLIECHARREDCELFIIAPRGTEFIVTGEIERVSSIDAELIHCNFQLVPKAVAQQCAAPQQPVSPPA